MKRTLIALATIALTGAAVAAPAHAKDGDIKIAGKCTGSSTSKLKLQPRPSDGKLEMEFEVDQNVNGQVWAVTISDNGTNFYAKNKTTVAPSGSFEVKASRSGATGHKIAAKAVNARTGETCTASGSV